MFKFAVLTMLLGSVASPAWAQAGGPVPARDMNAVSVSFGVAVPGDDTLGAGPTLGVAGEHYFTPRMSVRGRVSRAWFDIQHAGDNNGVGPLALSGNFVYNWERGIVHPFVTLGLEIDTFHFTEDGIDSHDTTGGVNLGGGVEYFIHRHDTIVAEALFHPIVGLVHSYRASYTPWYWTVTAGYKKYF